MDKAISKLAKYLEKKKLKNTKNKFGRRLTLKNKNIIKKRKISFHVKNNSFFLNTAAYNLFNKTFAILKYF